MRRFVFLLALLPLTVCANPKETIDLLFAVKSIDETALAPDGQRLLWVEKQHNADRTESRNSFLYVADDENAKPRRVTAGNGIAAHAEKNASWSRDGAQLAFLSDAAKAKQLQLYVTPAAPSTGSGQARGAVRKLTSVSGQLARPHWSPDGKTIALLFIEGQTQSAGAVEAAWTDSLGPTRELRSGVNFLTPNAWPRPSPCANMIFVRPKHFSARSLNGLQRQGADQIARFEPRPGRSPHHRRRA